MAKESNSSKMTEKQKKFCIEYLKDLNATQAAIRAGYSENTADVIGCENLGKPNIMTYVKEKLEAIAGPAEKDIYENIIFWREMRDDKEAPEAQRLKATELLAKYRGMFTEKVELSTKDDKPLKMKMISEIMGD